LLTGFAALLQLKALQLADDTRSFYLVSVVFNTFEKLLLCTPRLQQGHARSIGVCFEIVAKQRKKHIDL
jgi:hypothetical protein